MYQTFHLYDEVFLHSQIVEVAEDHLQFSGEEGPSAVFKYAMEGSKACSCYACSHHHRMLHLLMALPLICGVLNVMKPCGTCIYIQKCFACDCIRLPIIILFQLLFSWK